MDTQKCGIQNGLNPVTPDNVPLLFAALALITASLSPVVVWFFTRRATIADRTAEHKRQDKVAAQTAEAARLLEQKQNQIAAQAAEAARLLVEKQDQIAEVAAGAARLLAARQDEIASQAAEAARLLVESNAKVASAAARVGAETAASLGQIHTLVNSNLTDAQHRELDATRAQLKAMRKVIDMKAERGQDASVDDIASVAAVERRILDLARDLTHKEAMTQVASDEKKTRRPPP